MLLLRFMDCKLHAPGLIESRGSKCPDMGFKVQLKEKVWRAQSR